MRFFVVDASFLLNALEEKSVQASERLQAITKEMGRQEITIFAPSFLCSEMGNALQYSYRKDRLADALRVFKYFEKLPIEYREISSFQVSQSLKQSYQTQTSVYDTIYHLLALNLDAVFLTCDKKYYDQAKHLGNIELLSIS